MTDRVKALADRYHAEVAAGTQVVPRMSRHASAERAAVKSEFDRWYAKQGSMGDPLRNPFLLQDAYAAGRKMAVQESKDAARYRHIRNLSINQTGLPGVPCIAMPNGMKSGYYLTEETADHAIDTSMSGGDYSELIDDGRCRSCVADKCVIGPECVTLERDK